MSDEWLQPALCPGKVSTILEKQQLHTTIAKRLLCAVDDDRVVSLGVDFDDINNSQSVTLSVRVNGDNRYDHTFHSIRTTVDSVVSVYNVIDFGPWVVGPART